MHLVLAETALVDYIKNLFESLKDIIKEANFKFTKEGLEIKKLNNDHNILVSLKLDNFDKYEYRAKTPEKEIGINLIEFNKVIKTLSHDDKISFKIEDINDQKLLVIIVNSVSHRVSKHSIEAITTKINKTNPKEIDSEAVISMPSQDFQKVCRDINNLSDKISIMCLEKKISFSCQSSMGNHQIMYGETEGGRVFKMVSKTYSE